MGVLLKVILFGLVFYYILRTVGSFVIRVLGGGQQAPQTRQRQNQSMRREGEINIDYVPGQEKRRRSAGGSKEGDYIDYEEVK